MRAAVLLVASVTAMFAAACDSDAVNHPETRPIDELPETIQELTRLQYNDTNDLYRAFVVGRTEPLRLRGVRLALLSDEEIAAGKKPYVVDDGNGPIARIGSRYQIGVLHGVVEERVLPETNQRQNVVVRTELRMWSPFLAPKLVGNTNVWHTPAFHYPPPARGTALIGTGAHGPTREAAYDAYRRANGALPQAVHLEFEGFITEDKNAAVAPLPAATEAPASAKNNRVIGAVRGSKAEAELQKRKAAELAHKKNLPAQKKKTTP